MTPFRQPHKIHVVSSRAELTVIYLINSAVDMPLKSAWFSQLLSKWLVFMATWQTSPCGGCPPGCLLAHSSCMTQICHLKTRWPCLALVEWLGFLHSSPVSHYPPVCVMENRMHPGS